MATPYTHSPYGFDCIARSTQRGEEATRPPPYHELPPPPPPYKAEQQPPQPSWSVPSSAASSPIVRAAAPADEGIATPDFCFHSELANYGCEFVALPQNIPTPDHWASVDVSRCPRLFVGQVRFEITVEQLGALITYGCGVVPASVVYHRAGCLIVYLFTEEDRTLVRGLHRRLLFDVNGAWLAHNESELWAMDEYLQRCSPMEMRRYRLPRGALVIECFHAEAKRLAAAAAAAASHNGSPMSSHTSSPKHSFHHSHHSNGGYGNHRGATAAPRTHHQPHPQPVFNSLPPPPPHYMSRLKRHDSGLPSESSSDDYAAQN